MNEHEARTDPTTSMLRQMLEQNDEKHEEAHKRIRYDWRDHDRRLDDLERNKHEMVMTLNRIEQALEKPRVDVSTLRLTVGQWAFSIGVCLAVAGGWGATGWLAMQNSYQSAALKTSLDTLQRQSTMQDLKLQSLERMILTNGNIRRDQP